MQAFGINVPRMVTLTYGFGVGLAALAGVLAAPIYSVNPVMGSNLIFVVFAVVVIGGMGSILGSIITGFGLGVIEGLTKVFYPEASNTVIFIIMAIVLMLRPQVQQRDLPFSCYDHNLFSSSLSSGRCNLLSRFDVFGTAGGAFALRPTVFTVECQSDTASAHPASLAGRVSVNQRIIGNVPGHNGTGAHKSILADGGAANHGAVGAQRRTFANQRGLVLVFPDNMAPRVRHIGEDHRGSAEDVILKDTTGVDGNIVLDFNVVADHYVG